jgi:diguanylate cyclase (GGDEF)-like protein/PAS domain S-box-containing protein
MSVTPLGVSGGGGVVITHTNITERKLAAEKLALAASVFTHVREGIIITTPDGTIVDVNAAFTRITGYTRGEALGKNPRILSSGRQDRAFYTGLWSAVLGQGHWMGEVWNRRKDGEVYAEMLTISAVRDAQGVAQHFVALFSDITAQKQYQNQLQHIAHHDALTDLPNRVLLADRLRHGLVQAQRRGQMLGVAFLDLDGFKAINDVHGHQAGDHLLITLAARMKHVLRDGDTLARMGGDEFVAVIVDLDKASDCLPLLTRLLAVVALPVQFGNAELQVSASLGVTFFPQAQNLDADQLLRQADQAMYQAKLEGKNRYRVFA